MEKTSYAPGTPIWIDLGADVPKAEAFYGGLFGWTTTEPGPDDETGGYKMFMQGDKMVAGLGPQQAPGAPYWTTYIATADADATAKKVSAAGGMTMVEPMDVMDAGRMAIFADPTGAAFGIWQAGMHTGAQLVNEPDTWCWNELQTRDLDAAMKFYADVFGVGIGGAPEYRELQVGGESVAGAMTVPEGVPAEVPANWLTYFAVADCEAAMAKAQSLGGTVLMGPMDVEVGRFAVVLDDQGAAFAVIKMKDASH
jgi:predicted enzyme related to lactoylglutathione lyase